MSGDWVMTGNRYGFSGGEESDENVLKLDSGGDGCNS